MLGVGTLVSHGFGLALVPAMLPFINAELGTGYGVLGSAIAAGLITYSLGALASRWIIDRLPNRSLLAATFATTGIGLLLAAAADSAWLVTAAVVVLGFTAPVSWTLTLHVAGVTVAPRSRSMVMAGASSGAAVGVLINGLLVQTSSTVHSWRVSFLIAAGIALVPIVGSALLYRTPIAPPRSGSAAMPPGLLRTVLATSSGRIVIAASLVAGAAGFPFNVFLTATAVDELAIEPLGAAGLWWIIGLAGTTAGPVLGRLGDRRSPLLALLAGSVSYAAGLAVLTVLWGFTGLVVAAIGYSLMNYPIWGLVGAVANESFDRALAVSTISLGLVAASTGGAAANAIVGWWIDRTGSFRAAVAVMAAAAAILTLWYVSVMLGRKTARAAGNH